MWVLVVLIAIVCLLIGGMVVMYLDMKKEKVDKNKLKADLAELQSKEKIITEFSF